MKGYDFEPGDTIVANGHLHHSYRASGSDVIRKAFHGNETLLAKVNRGEEDCGFELDSTKIHILETDDTYAVVEMEDAPGAYVTDKSIFDEYLFILEIISAAPVIPQEALLGLLV